MSRADLLVSLRVLSQADAGGEEGVLHELVEHVHRRRVHRCQGRDRGQWGVSFYEEVRG